jgi:hypothetical protein
VAKRGGKAIMRAVAGDAVVRDTADLGRRQHGGCVSKAQPR